jgi:hypothetical protein
LPPQACDPAHRDNFGELPVKIPTTLVVDRSGKVAKNITGRVPA